MSNHAEEGKDLRRVIVALSQRLIEYAGEDVEAMPPLEGDEGRVIMVHAKSCGSSCDYGCGAVSIMYAGAGSDDNEDDGIPVVESVEYGNIRVRGLGGDH